MNSPKQLGQAGKRYFQRIVKELPPLDNMQIDLLTLMASSWELYWTAEQDLQNYVTQNGTLNVVGSTGQMRSHPSFAIQDQAHNRYLRAARQLLSTFKPATEALTDETLERFFDE